MDVVVERIVREKRIKVDRTKEILGKLRGCSKR